MAYGEFEESRAGDFVPALLLLGVGVMVGLVAGMLTAPAAGRDTRERFGELLGRGKEKLSRLRNRTEEQFEELTS